MRAGSFLDSLRGVNAGRLLGYAGIVVSLVIGSSAIVDFHLAAGHGLAHWGVLAQFLLLAGFAGALWYNTRADAPPGKWLSFALLAFQVVAGLSVTADLLFLVAAEIPLAVRSRSSFLWVGGLAAALVAVSIAAAWQGDFSVSETVAHSPRVLGMVLTVAMGLAWILVAFSCGYVILQLEESRNATLWAKAQLEGSQHLLAETARIGERLRISRELHDTIGHSLVGLSINLEVASQVAGEAARAPIERSQLVARMLLADTRELLNTVRNDSSADLRPALERLADAMKRPACHLEVAADVEAGPAAARVLFRCAQEAITNAARHGRAANVWVKIERRDGKIRFEARDDGRGAPHILAGNGLRGMRERLKELGGELEIESAPGRGFALRGWIPADGGAA
jgi:signal transduction histidine kinase